MVDYSGLDEREVSVLRTIADSSPMGEDRCHSLYSALDASGRGLGFSYEWRQWHDIDPRLSSDLGSAMFSEDLHTIIDGLVSKSRLARDKGNLLVLRVA